MEALKLGQGEGDEMLPQSSTLVQPQAVVQTPEIISHEGEPTNMTGDEKIFRKDFFDMIEMVKFLYEERDTRLQGESSKPPKGEASSGGRNGNGDKP